VHGIVVPEIQNQTKQRRKLDISQRAVHHSVKVSVRPKSPKGHRTKRRGGRNSKVLGQETLLSINGRHTHGAKSKKEETRDPSGKKRTGCQLLDHPICEANILGIGAKTDYREGQGGSVFSSVPRDTIARSAPRGRRVQAPETMEGRPARGRPNLHEGGETESERWSRRTESSASIQTRLNSPLQTKEEDRTD